MATHIMLQQRNSYERVIKLQVNRLTLQGRLSSLGSTKEGFWLRRLAGRVPVAVVAVAVAACAGLGGVNKDSPPDVKAAVVKERSEARWQALIKGDLDAAYAYLSPGSKAATPIEAYRRQIRPGMWRAAKVDSVECDGELCNVRLQLTYDIGRGRSSSKAIAGIETPIAERWVIENGSAWFVYK
jgi:hypothetical protein